MQNQEDMHTMYNVKDPIDILFDQIKMEKNFLSLGTRHFLSPSVRHGCRKSSVDARIYTCILHVEEYHGR